MSLHAPAGWAERVFINQGCTFLDYGGIRLGEGVMVGPKATFITVGHPMEPDERRHVLTDVPIDVAENVWIGAGGRCCRASASVATPSSRPGRSWPTMCQRHEIRCVMGTCFGGLPTHECELATFWGNGAARVSPLAIHRSMSNAPAAALAIRWALHGPARGVATACAAGSDAIGLATRMIQCGDAKAVLAGRTESSVTGYTLEMGPERGSVFARRDLPAVRRRAATGW